MTHILKNLFPILYSTIFILVACIIPCVKYNHQVPIGKFIDIRIWIKLLKLKINISLSKSIKSNIKKQLMTWIYACVNSYSSTRYCTSQFHLPTELPPLWKIKNKFRSVYIQINTNGYKVLCTRENSADIIFRKLKWCFAWLHGLRAFSWNLVLLIYLLDAEVTLLSLSGTMWKQILSQVQHWGTRVNNDKCWFFPIKSSVRSS